jgi:glycosyltransferase involved in cell wall biosynthesis
MKNNHIFCSVVMAAYNAENTIRKSIESILQQTFTYFEFIIINDGSTDKTREIVESYSDPRIILINNESNRFLPTCLNIGIKRAQGDYIIRMDADDIALPSRIEKQVQYMEVNPSIGFSSSWFKIFGNKSGIGKYETRDELIKIKMLHECHMLHPALIIRMSVIEKYNLYYDESYRKNQDYELFIRAMKFTKFGNLTDVLLEYCQTEQNEKRNSLNQVSTIFNLQSSLFAKLGVTITEKELALYKDLNYRNFSELSSKLNELVPLLERMISLNRQSNYFDQDKFESYIQELFISLIRNCVQSNSNVLNVFNKANLNITLWKKYYYLTLFKAKLIVK